MDIEGHPSAEQFPPSRLREALWRSEVKGVVSALRNRGMSLGVSLPLKLSEALTSGSGRALSSNLSRAAQERISAPIANANSPFELNYNF